MNPPQDLRKYLNVFRGLQAKKKFIFFSWAWGEFILGRLKWTQLGGEPTPLMWGSYWWTSGEFRRGIILFLCHKPQGSIFLSSLKQLYTNIWYTQINKQTFLQTQLILKRYSGCLNKHLLTNLFKLILAQLNNDGYNS